MARAIVAALLVAGCYRSAPPASEPPQPRPVVEEPRPGEPATPRPAHVRTGRAPTPPPVSFTDALARLTEFADEMCACTDRACIDAVSDEMRRWTSEVPRDNPDLTRRPTPEEARQATEAGERMAKCMMALMTPPP